MSAPLSPLPPPRAPRSVKEKGLKYLGVSVINVVVGQSLLLTFHAILGWPQAAANAAAVMISAFPAYYLSRRVGVGQVRPEPLQEGGPAVLDLRVHRPRLLDAHGRPRCRHHRHRREPANLALWEKLLPNVLNAASFFILWIVRFFLMEKLFEQHPELAEELVGEDFIIAVEGEEKLAAAEAAAAERAGPVDPTAAQS